MAATALVYAAIGALAVALAAPGSLASPLYPGAGIALVAVLMYGRAAVPGVLIGSFAVSAGLTGAQDRDVVAAIGLSTAIAAGAAAQAVLGAVLVRRFVGRPLVLDAPLDILRFGLGAGALACCTSASVATAALWASGSLAPETAQVHWFTWWIGDTLGVLIGAPLALTVVGRPADAWHPRRRAVGLPLVLTLGLVGGGLSAVEKIDERTRHSRFERAADGLASLAAARLVLPLHALQALHGAVPEHGPLDTRALKQATRWWLEQSVPMQAMGYGERVDARAVAAFETAVRADGYATYRVFDRDGGVSRTIDREVLALRRVEPLAGNERALGVNALSIPAARQAILAARDSGLPAVTAAFGLTQSANAATGIVLYQALYAGPVDNAAARRASFRGVVFVTVRPDLALGGLTGAGPPGVHWCLLDADTSAQRRVLAGAEDCSATGRTAGSGLDAVRPLQLGNRLFELRIHTDHGDPMDRPGGTLGLLPAAVLAAAALLGALLLTMTGQARRTERDVAERTSALQREMDDRVQAQSALRESEQRLRSILDHAPIGVMFTDPEGGVIECNPRLCTMLGIEAGTLLGRSLTAIVPPEEAHRVLAMRRELLAGAQSSVLEPLSLRAGDGEEVTVRVRASALRNAEGRVLHLVGVVENMSEHRRLLASEQALQRAEAASRAKSEFLSRMSHELRTPLNAMIGFAQLLTLDRKFSLAPHQREWAQLVQRAGWHLLELINDTLDLARVESGAVRLQPGPVAVGPVVAACLATVRQAAALRGVRLIENGDGVTSAVSAAPAVSAASAAQPAVLAVLADPTRLEQILTNLLSNAVKYNREGGTVTVDVRSVAPGAGAANPGGESAGAPADAVPDGSGGVEIRVSDTGLGMTDGQLASLFQPYNRLGRENSGIEGTGIGLVISRRLAELMGGTLQAISVAGAGSTFSLRLPAATPTEAPASSTEPTRPLLHRQRLVHYIEDNETNVEVMRGVLAQRPQIRLEVSLLGLEGLAAVHRTQPDLVLLDMQLPDISGIELLRRLKNDDTVARIPVLVVSADAMPAHIQDALTSGALRYITKPLDVPAFLAAVDDILAAD